MTTWEVFAVVERLPEQGQEVLVWSGYGWSVARLAEEHPDGWYSYDDECDTGRITHWSPLPPVPESPIAWEQVTALLDAAEQALRTSHRPRLGSSTLGRLKQVEELREGLATRNGEPLFGWEIARMLEIFTEETGVPQPQR